MPRFVVLYHDVPAGQPRPSHWDLMFEERDGLRTWALPQQPDAREPMLATALADHRLQYLEYEGPISHGRGSVTRWDEGTYVKKPAPPGSLHVAVIGARLQGEIELAPLADSQRRWRFTFRPARAESSA
jgi:hypothetical protein